MAPPMTDRELGALAAAVSDAGSALTPTERIRAAEGRPPSPRRVAQVREAVLRGEDPLGTAFCQLRAPAVRRKAGAVYTPQAIVDAMVRWAANAGAPKRIVDPGAGSGRFLLAAGKAFPSAELVAVEIDPLAALMMRANAAALGLADRLTVMVADYRGIELPAIAGSTLFLGNPPYVRHHDIEPAWKGWFAETASAHGFKASKLAGLHAHFFLKTRQLARAGDYGAFITAAEWLDVNYGAVVRNLLVDGLGGESLHVVAPHGRPFSDAATTSAIACFRVGASEVGMRLRQVETVAGLGALAGGSEIARARLEAAPRWSAFLRPRRRPAPPGHIELGEICRVHRGQVTGCNAAWIAGGFAGELPESLLIPTVTKARELLRAAPELREARDLRRVADLPVDLDELDGAEREQVERFLRWARDLGADRSYIARNRRAWWAVGLREPAPILCTYMARRPPAFVRNLCQARHLNIAHGLYPRAPLPAATLANLTAWLQREVCVSDGRTYAGGLTKFEPKELERIAIPPLETLHGRAEALDAGRVNQGR